MKREHFAIATVVAAAASIIWTACGVKSPPVPPQWASPEKIIDLAGVSVKNGIELEWERPTNYASGRTMRDLGKFLIMRANPGGQFEELDQIAVTDQARFQQQHRFSWIDKGTIIGNTYDYEVISETLDGYASEPSNKVIITRKKPAPAPNPENFVVPRTTPLP